jgi:4-hydroxy-tetrahydrodipicolinate synthase
MKLEGVYAGLPTPWKADYSFDADSLVENVRRCKQAGAHGVYILSPAGEFWSVGFAEFKEIVAVFAEAVRANAIPAQVYCGWQTTAGVIQRVQFCHEQGFEVVQVGCPSWYGLNKQEAIGFFGDVSRACPEVGLVHYNNPKQNWLFDADDYLRALDAAPTLVGTKSISWNFGEIVDLIQRTPQLVHFYPETVLLPAMLAGAKGSYSSAIYFQPETMLRLYQAIVEGRTAEAMRLTARFVEFGRQTDALFARYGAADAAYDKLVAHLTGFLQVGPTLRPPHRQIPEAGMAELRAILAEFPEWNWSASGHGQAEG